jgi:hypothetical protein
MEAPILEGPMGHTRHYRAVAGGWPGLLDFRHEGLCDELPPCWFSVSSCNQVVLYFRVSAALLLLFAWLVPVSPSGLSIKDTSSERPSMTT